MASEAERLIAVHRDAARRVSARAWAPHSGMQVGAIALDAAGHVFAGCNVESDSYGLTQCAERNAVGAAIAAGAGRGALTALLVYVPGEKAVPPCGACRQVMVELLAPDALVVSCCDGDEHIAWRPDDLLPDAFRLS